MICGRLEGWRKIEGIKGLEAGLEFLERANLAALPDGRHAIQGDEVYALVMRAPSKSPADARFESHRDYIDIQYLLSGDETMGVLPIEELAGRLPTIRPKTSSSMRHQQNTLRSAFRPATSPCSSRQTGTNRCATGARRGNCTRRS